MYYNLIDNPSQVAKYTDRKSLSLKVADAYDHTDDLYYYGALIRGCGDTLLVRRYEGDDMEIAHAMFCRCRLCPMCAWRRSLKAYGQLSDCLSYLDDQAQSGNMPEYAQVFVSLTLRNVQGCDLPDAVGNLIDGFRRLQRSREWSRAIKGAHRALEVTYNRDADTYHPHLHILCLVRKSYFSSASYISQSLLTSLWRRAIGVDYDPVVDIRRVKSDQSGVIVREVTKYVTKAALWTDIDIAPAIVSDLHHALHGRKLIALSGVLREVSRTLHQTDEDGDLVAIGGETDEQRIRHLRGDVAYTLLSYTWTLEYGYVQIPPSYLPPSMQGKYAAIMTYDTNASPDLDAHSMLQIATTN